MNIISKNNQMLLNELWQQHPICATGTGHRFSRIWQMRLQYPKQLACFTTSNEVYNENCKFWIELKPYVTKLVEWLLSKDVTLLITGGAICFDRFLEEAWQKIMQQSSYTFQLKEKPITIDTSKLVHLVAVPCLQQDSRWSKNEKQRYQRVLDQATYVYQCDDRKYVEPKQMYVRDTWMVEQAKYVVTMYFTEMYNTSMRSGTGLTLKMAIAKGRVVTGFHPITKQYFSTIDGSFPPQSK